MATFWYCIHSYIHIHTYMTSPSSIISKETFETEKTTDQSTLILQPDVNANQTFIIEVGPRMAFRTAWSSNCSSICQACGIASVNRIERSRRYLVHTYQPLTSVELKELKMGIHDRMLEEIYLEVCECTYVHVYINKHIYIHRNRT